MELRLDYSVDWIKIRIRIRIGLKLVWIKIVYDGIKIGLDWIRIGLDCIAFDQDFHESMWTGLDSVAITLRH